MSDSRLVYENIKSNTTLTRTLPSDEYVQHGYEHLCHTKSPNDDSEDDYESIRCFSTQTDLDNNESLAGEIWQLSLASKPKNPLPPTPLPRRTLTNSRISTNELGNTGLNNSPSTSDILQSTSCLIATTPVIQNPTPITENSTESVDCLRSLPCDKQSKLPPKTKPKPSTTCSQISAAQSSSQSDFCNSPSSPDILQSRPTSSLKTTPPFLPNLTCVNENSQEPIGCLRSRPTNERPEQSPNLNPKPSNLFSQISTAQSTSQLDLCNSPSTSPILHNRSTSNLKTKTPCIQNSTSVPETENSSGSNTDFRAPNFDRRWEPTSPRPNTKPLRPFLENFAPQWISQIQLDTEPVHIYRTASLSQLLDSEDILEQFGDDDKYENGLGDVECSKSKLDLFFDRRKQDMLLQIEVLNAQTKLAMVQATIQNAKEQLDQSKGLESKESTKKGSKLLVFFRRLRRKKKKVPTATLR